MGGGGTFDFLHSDLFVIVYCVFGIFVFVCLHLSLCLSFCLFLYFSLFAGEPPAVSGGGGG